MLDPIQFFLFFSFFFFAFLSFKIYLNFPSKKSRFKSSVAREIFKIYEVFPLKIFKMSESQRLNILRGAFAKSERNLWSLIMHSECTTAIKSWKNDFFDKSSRLIRQMHSLHKLFKIFFDFVCFPRYSGQFLCFGSQKSNFFRFWHFFVGNRHSKEFFF